MSWVMKFATSSIGAKVVMALTGLALFAFATIHMAGHLQMFLGQQAYNDYAEFLKSKPGVLWGARLGLLVFVVVHIASGVRLEKLNMAARPIRYAVGATVKATLSSRAMAVTGLLLLAFLIYHLLHFTVHAVDPGYASMVDAAGRHDAYGMMVTGFQSPLTTAVYAVSMVFLCMHLSHGATSMFQSLGLSHPRYDGLIAKVGPAFAGVLWIGYVVVPVSILLGYVR